jgi:hypothetical protein
MQMKFSRTNQTQLLKKWQAVDSNSDPLFRTELGFNCLIEPYGCHGCVAFSSHSRGRQLFKRCGGAFAHFAMQYRMLANAPWLMHQLMKMIIDPDDS